MIDRDAASCPHCGTLVRPGAAVLELVLDDGRRFPISAPLTIGRAHDNRLRLQDPTVSRHHARIVPTADGARVEDAGSSHGTFVDGRRVHTTQALRDGSDIHVGNAHVRVERRRDEQEPGRTIVVARDGLPPRRTDDALTDDAVAVAAVAEIPPASEAARRPRVRGGWALKRLEAAEGTKRYVVRDLETDTFLRMSADEAALFALLDGRRGLPELLVESERRLGADGPTCLARLLADLADHGLLEDSVAAPVPLPGRLARLLRPRELVIRCADTAFARAYHAGGFLLFTPPVLALLGVVGVAGLIAFALMLVEGARTPFVVGGSLRAGVPVFIVGRFLIVALHELAHGLAVASMGRRVPRAGIKLLLVFPYAFVDTSEAWFEPRRRRMLISAAGPASDLVLAGVCSLVALAAGASVAGDVAFQLALGAYLGAFFNLNPFLDRDGYQLLVDALREPNLRRRSRDRVTRALAGRASAGPDERLLLVYGVSALAWSLLGLGFAAALTSRYVDRLRALAPSGVVWALVVACYLLAATPVLVAIARPLYERRRSPTLDRERLGT